MRLTLCENMRAVPYVPFYLAFAGWKPPRSMVAKLVVTLMMRAQRWGCAPAITSSFPGSSPWTPTAASG